MRRCFTLQLTEKLANAEAEIQATKMTRDGLLMQAESRIAAQGAGIFICILYYYSLINQVITKRQPGTSF